MRLVLLGPPGAGKGTQALGISKSRNIVHLSSGDILRAERKAKSELGQKAQDYMDRGVLVPDDLILSMMIDHITRPAASAGFLLDGFPRTVVQAEGLDERLAAKDMKLDMVVNIDVPDEDVVKRLGGRWSAPKSGRVYHEIFSPPKAPGVCDESGETLIRRPDDEPAVIKQRLETYHEQTEPLISYYRDRGILKTVDGSGKPEDVTKLIEKVCAAG